MSKTIQEVKDNLELSKQRTQSLIDQANEVTGNEDTDLTSAVGSLVSGFGQGGSGVEMLSGTFMLDVSDAVLEIPVSKKCTNILIFYPNAGDWTLFSAYSNVGAWIKEGLWFLIAYRTYNNSATVGGITLEGDYDYAFHSSTYACFYDSSIKFRGVQSGTGNQKWVAGIEYHWLAW